MYLAALILTVAAVPTSSVATVAPIERGKSVNQWLAGSAVGFTTAANLQTFATNQQLTHNPAVTSAFVVTPRVNLLKGLALTGRFGFSYDWTNNDFTKTEHEPLLLDTSVGVNYLGLPALPWGSRIGLSAGFILPTSKISQARTMVVTPNASVQMWHVFSGVLGGRLITSASGGYQHAFYRFTTPGVVDDLPYQRQCFGNDVTCVEQASGLANISDVLSWTVAAVGQWGMFSPGAAFGLQHQFPHAFDQIPVPDDIDPSTIRVASSFNLWTDVFLPAGVTARVGYTFNRDIIAGDGRFGNPFYDRYQDGQLYVTLRVAPFAEATPLRAQKSEEAEE